MQQFLDHFPVITFTFVVLVVVGAVKSIVGDLDYGELIEYAKDLGIGLGILGGARAVVSAGASIGSGD